MAAPEGSRESKTVSRFAQASRAPRALTPIELDLVDDASLEWRRTTAQRLRLRGAAWSRRLDEANGVEYAMVERLEPVRVVQLTIWGGERVRVVGFRRVPRFHKLRTLFATHYYPHKIAEWHARRAASVERGVRKKIALCGSRKLACACRGCGKHHEILSRCDDRLCSPCSVKFYSSLRSRLVASCMVWLAAHSHRGQRAPTSRRTSPSTVARVLCPTCDHCGRQHPEHGKTTPRVQLWTLTVAHGANAAETRARITRAWVRLRASLWAELRYAIPYALVWEWTAGTGAHGAHVHAHVLTVAPPLCYRVLSAWWNKATRCSNRLCGRRVAGKCQGHSAGVGHPKGRKGRGCVSATTAARYIAKYASKGSGVFEGEPFDPALVAEVWCASYARRRVTASVAFWALREQSVTPCCKAPWVVLASWGLLPANDVQASAPARAPPVDEWAEVDARLRLVAMRARMEQERWLLGLRGLRRVFPPSIARVTLAPVGARD